MFPIECCYNFIEQQEGKKNVAYKDSNGFWTIGIGHKIKPDEKYLLSIVASDALIKQLFKQDAQSRADWINEYCFNWQPAMVEEEFIALMSFLWQYNIDSPNYPNTRQAIINGDRDIIYKQMMQFKDAKAVGNDNMMLNRRKQEIALMKNNKGALQCQLD